MQAGDATVRLRREKNLDELGETSPSSKNLLSRRKCDFRCFRTVEQGAKQAVKMALIGPDGPKAPLPTMTVHCPGSRGMVLVRKQCIRLRARKLCTDPIVERAITECISSGLAVLTLMLATDSRTVGVVMIVFALIPLGDMTNILVSGGKKATAFSVHGVTFAVMLVAGLLLIRVI